MIQIKELALADLRKQRGQQSFQTSLFSLVGLYRRHPFRSRLAVRRDWTPSCDYIGRLAVPLGGHVVALIGQIREQPVYSDNFPGASKARDAGIKLEGGLTQYVIRFDYPPNEPAQKWIHGPFQF